MENMSKSNQFMKIIVPPEKSEPTSLVAYPVTERYGNTQLGSRTFCRQGASANMDTVSHTLAIPAMSSRSESQLDQHLFSSNWKRD